MEASESELIHTAISCIEKASASSAQQADGFELFSKYVANELRAISNPQAQQCAKLQIQTVLYNAQTEAFNASHPMLQQPVYHMGSPS